VKYSKPQLHSYSALSVVLETGDPIKQTDNAENPPDNVFPTDPAYQADE